MAGTPLEIAQQRLDLYLAAEAAVLEMQEYRFPNGRMVRKADLADLRAEINILIDRVAQLTPAAGGRLIRVVPE